jgi:single-stranded DNA-binding protein
MNIITACAKYTGHTPEVNAMRFEIPGKGKSAITPIFLLPGFAAQETSVPGAFQEGSTLLIGGRLYKRVQTEDEIQEKGKDERMYVIPTQELQVVDSKTELNHVTLAGGVGFKKMGKSNNGSEVISFGLMCQAEQQKQLNHTWKDSVGFKIEAWNTDAQRLNKFIFVGRQIAIGGALKFECWTGKDGTKNTDYKIRVKSSQYSFFGKNKLEEKKETAPVLIKESPKSETEVDDKIPF